ncbi:unnamed protein product [Trifolium pratense]|uniref:Uncharacterized protein n=1 Tax=Trifolium pratense TaxID=57577 RepID=A0ACB0IRL4_TRIPR|nr:unnamed protein product [Trifolium pratense]
MPPSQNNLCAIEVEDFSGCVTCRLTVIDNNIHGSDNHDLFRRCYRAGRLQPQTQRCFSSIQSFASHTIYSSFLLRLSCSHCFDRLITSSTISTKMKEEKKRREKKHAERKKINLGKLVRLAERESEIDGTHHSGQFRE